MAPNDGAPVPIHAETSLRAAKQVANVVCPGSFVYRGSLVVAFVSRYCTYLCPGIGTHMSRYDSPFSVNLENFPLIISYD
jgi:hypothetical protein